MVGSTIFAVLLSSYSPAYDVIDLGTLPGASMSSATGINNVGQIVGESGDGYYESQRAVLWDKAGIHLLKSRGLPGTANAINDKGRIVGETGDLDHPRAYMWSAGRATILKGLVGRDSRAYGIDDNDEVVGVSGINVGGVIGGHLFFWRTGKETVLDVQPDDRGDEGCGINNRGEVVGVKGYGRGGPFKGEDHGLSVFFQLGDEVLHTYSAYARGVEGLADAYSLLDVTPYGRQQDFEDSPAGWPQRPTYG